MAEFDPLFDIADRTIIVVGAAGGLGSAITDMLAERGARLFLADTDKERLTALAASLGGEVGVHVRTSLTMQRCPT